GFSLDATDRVELAFAVGLGTGRNHMEQGIDAETTDHRTWLAAIEVLLPMHPAVLARRNIHSHAISIVHHHPIATDVDPTFVRIARDHHMDGADVPATVALMPNRHRKLK